MQLICNNEVGVGRLLVHYRKLGKNCNTVQYWLLFVVPNSQIFGSAHCGMCSL